MKITIKYGELKYKINTIVGLMKPHHWVMVLATGLAIGATYFSFTNDIIIAYGDSESHLNISKRVVDSLTPGFAQLGGIWLPLHHLLMSPLVYFDYFWRTGLAGSIVSGISFIIAAVYIYKLTHLITKNVAPSFLAALVFMLNPNVLYLQSTPMTEVLLIVFFVLSSYFFIRYLYDRQDLNSLLLAALFGFLASLSRYDGWLLVLTEAFIIVLINLPHPIAQGFFTLKGVMRTIKKNIRARKETFAIEKREELIGKLVLFSTLALFGIFLWLGWDALILGDPLYFTHSEFSAKSQQLGWAAKGQLPAQNNLLIAFVYYFVTSMSNVGVLIFLTSIVGLIYYLIKDRSSIKQYVAVIMLVPFIFYVATLYLGQSIIFIPHITPDTFEWTLFNVRYGVMMVPAAAIFVGYIFYKSKNGARSILVTLLVFQMALFGVGFAKVISLDDGVIGLSASEKSPDPQKWLAQNYDGGYVLLDDFKRLMSIIRIGVDMKDVIYIGNKPYWEESLVNPEKYATWVIVQKDDELWNKVYAPEAAQGHLYKHFTKVYTSPDILIFKRTKDIDDIARSEN